jgi:hypothetical protein
MNLLRKLRRKRDQFYTSPSEVFVTGGTDGVRLTTNDPVALVKVVLQRAEETAANLEPGDIVQVKVSVEPYAHNRQLNEGAWLPLLDCSSIVSFTNPQRRLNREKLEATYTFTKMAT